MSISYGQIPPFSPSPIIFGSNFIDEDCHSVGIDHCPNFIGGLSTIASKGDINQPYFVIQRYKRNTPFSINNDLQSYVIDKTHFIVSRDGDVGIGTDSPNYKFHLNGTGYSSGNFYIDGDIGIGTTSPTEKLHVNGHGLFTGYLTINQGNEWRISGTDFAFGIKDQTANIYRFWINKSNGNIGIGTDTPEEKLHVVGNTKITDKLFIGVEKMDDWFDKDAKLHVDGKIVCKEAVIRPDGWADYVFDEDYELMPLAEVKSFIEENKHLPEVPSEVEVLENGVGIGEMNMLLLQKVEELTLYVIELEEKINQLSEKK